MSISSVSSSSIAPALHGNEPPRITQFKRDRHGDYDNNAVPIKRSGTEESGKPSAVLDIKA